MMYDVHDRAHGFQQPRVARLGWRRREREQRGREGDGGRAYLIASAYKKFLHESCAGGGGPLRQHGGGHSTLSITVELTSCEELRKKEGRQLAGEAKTRWRAAGDHAHHLYWLQASQCLGLGMHYGVTWHHHTQHGKAHAGTHGEDSLVLTFRCLDQNWMRSRLASCGDQLSNTRTPAISRFHKKT